MTNDLAVMLGRVYNHSSNSHNILMNPSIPREGVDLERAEAIKKDVDLKSLISFNYAYLWQQIDRQLLRRYIRLPSPFRQPGDSSKSLVLFDDVNDVNRTWQWADPMAPSHIPRDVIGFTMAFDKISYEDAMEKLWRLLPLVKRNKAQAERHRDTISPPIKNQAITSESGHIRERLAALGDVKLDKPSDSAAQQKRKRAR
jgi:hypothetical protein